MPRSRSIRFSAFPVLILLTLAACAPMRVPGGPGPTEPRLEAKRFVTADGLELPLRRWMPDETRWPEPRAVFLALHGFNDYSMAFDAPARYWAERGIATYAYDQRGFGAGPHAGLWPGSVVMVEDAKTASRLLAERYPEVPLYILGESMGGAVVTLAFADDDPPPATGAILSAPAVWARETMPGYQRVGLWLLVRVIPWGRYSGGGPKVQASDNIEMLRGLGRDPLFIKRTRVDAVDGLTQLMSEAYAAAPRVEGRVLLLYGEKDQLVPRQPTLDFWRGLPPGENGRQRKALYANGWHLLLRDLEADVVRDDVLAWIEHPERPLPSGADQSAEQALLADEAGEADGAVAAAGGGDGRAQDGQTQAVE